MTLRRRKSRKAQAADVLGTYLKFKAAGKAAKGAKKAATGTAVYQAAKRTPVVKKIPLFVAGAAAAAFVAVKALNYGGDSEQPAGA
ncbi:MAG TPA: hypothetical protein VI006_04235 [Solirubrobacteraceae bacterium]